VTTTPPTEELMEEVHSEFVTGDVLKTPWSYPKSVISVAQATCGLFRSVRKKGMLTYCDPECKPSSPEPKEGLFV
jgi:hypothetical protein